MNQILVPDFLAFTAGIVVFFVGVQLNRHITWLRSFNIPEPVTGGLLAALTVFVLYLLTGKELSFEMETRDRLLVYFFTTIGLNARLSDLTKGGRPVAILLVLTLVYIVVQNIVGIAGATITGMPPQVGLLAGSVSLIGGHGTAIAWAKDIADAGITNSMEIGIASATLGLVVASLVGGPIASFLIRRHQLKCETTDKHVVGVGFEDEADKTIDHLTLMSAVMVLHIAIVAGWFLHQGVNAAGFKLPLFVTCLLAGIFLSNVVPILMPKVHWPARSRALAVISDFSLGIFLAMSLMSMQLWTIASLAGPLLVILALQTLAAVVFIVFLLFPLMGKDYMAAVLGAGFGGFALGATPTAIANMTAVTKANGPAPLALIILPLISAFFVDITNAFVIRFALSWM